MKKIFFLALLAVFFTGCSGSKLVCESDEGSITLYYNDSGITAYTASNIDYDMDGQNEILDEIGVERYLAEFSNWFTTNTTGSCTNVQK